MIGPLTQPRAVAWVLLGSFLSFACVAWFLWVAIHNEKLAARQREAARHEEVADSLQLRAQVGIEDLRRGLQPVPGEDAAQTFERLVRSGRVDSVIVQGSSDDECYPSLYWGKETLTPEPLEEASRLEFQAVDHAAAMLRYQEAAAAATDPLVSSRALLGQARCLARLGRDQEARVILVGPLQDEDRRTARDRGGDLIRASALMRAVELAPRKSRHEARQLAELLRQDAGASMSVSQRLFLGERLRHVFPELPGIPELQAERIALEFLASVPASDSIAGALEEARPGWWFLGSTSGRVVGLLRDSTLRRFFTGVLAGEGDDWKVVAPRERPEDSAVIEVALGEALPGWRLAANRPGGMSQRERDLFLMGGLSLLVIAIVAILVIRSIRGQARLAAWKSELVSTVSHEMRTPLASVQALVETLLEGRCRDEDQRREYLGLIARENSRLGQMIEHFLSFARMEQGKDVFRDRPVDLREVTEGAAESARQRHPERMIRLHAPANIPTIRGEPRALATAILNLIDNAAKYSEVSQPVDVRLDVRGDRVVVEVEDRGIGLSRVEAGRVFDRFYRADCSLTRKQDGVGLGLSIVKFIVDAHQGRIRVSSKRGRGSRFAMEFSVPNGSAASPVSWEGTP